MTKLSVMRCTLQCSGPQHPPDIEQKISVSLKIHSDTEYEGIWSCSVPRHPRYMDWWEAMRLENRRRWVARREPQLALNQYAGHWDLCEQNDQGWVAGTATEKMSVVQLDADVDLQTVSQSDRNGVPHHVHGTLSSLATEVLAMEDRQTTGFETCSEWGIQLCQSKVLPTPFH
jgi:hypothetical protein